MMLNLLFNLVRHSTGLELPQVSCCFHCNRFQGFYFGSRGRRVFTACNNKVPRLNGKSKLDREPPRSPKV